MSKRCVEYIGRMPGPRKGMAESKEQEVKGSGAILFGSIIAQCVRCGKENGCQEPLVTLSGP